MFTIPVQKLIRCIINALNYHRLLWIFLFILLDDKSYIDVGELLAHIHCFKLFNVFFSVPIVTNQIVLIQAI